MLSLGGPPKFKAKKIAADDFQNLIGDLHVSIGMSFVDIIIVLVDDLWFNEQVTTYFILRQM